MERWSLALTDQGIVSGTRFILTILVGRLAGADELGHYSLAFSALILYGCLQEAVISTPFAVHFHRLRARSRAAYAGGSLLLHWLIAAFAGFSMLGLAGVSYVADGQPAWTRMALVVAATVPFSLMWEFARRTLLAQLDTTNACRLDACVAGLQILGVALFAIVGRLTADTALLVVAIGSLTGALLWLSRSQSERIVDWKRTGLYWRRNWRLGKWLVAGQIVGAFHSMIPFLILSMLASAAETGVFAAYFNIALLANPLILAVANLLTGRTAQAFNAEGTTGVARLVRTTVLGVTSVLLVFAVTLDICGERIVGLVYGAQYLGHASILFMLGLCPLVWSISVTCSCGLAALRYPRGSFIASSIGTSVSVVAILLAVREWSVMGAAAGLLTGGTIAAILHLVIFTNRCRQNARGVESQVCALEQPAIRRGEMQECSL